MGHEAEHLGTRRRVRWGWIVSALGMAVVAAVTLLASASNCADGLACGTGTPFVAKGTIIVVAAMIGIAWCVRRALPRRRP